MLPTSPMPMEIFALLVFFVISLPGVIIWFDMMNSQNSKKKKTKKGS